MGNRDYNLKNHLKIKLITLRKVFVGLYHIIFCFIKKFGNTTVEFLAIDTNLEKIKTRTHKKNGQLIHYLKAKRVGE